MPTAPAPHLLPSFQSATLAYAFLFRFSGRAPYAEAIGAASAIVFAAEMAAEKLSGFHSTGRCFCRLYGAARGCLEARRPLICHFAAAEIVMASTNY